MTNLSADLSDGQFQKVSRIVQECSGIHLKKGKEALVRARLMKRLRALKMVDFDEYLDFIDSEEGRRELDQMIDAMTTNKTSFFREAEHFRFLREEVLPGLASHRLRFWSAACSSGEEPYSLAIELLENLKGVDRKDVRILATDVSKRILEKAAEGVYPEAAVEMIPRPVLQRYFTCTRQMRPREYRVGERVRSLVHLAWLNLMERWPMRGPFQLIFCRNVMIYFDRLTQQRLINRFYDLLEPGGHLFVGHSEGLSAIEHRFHYIRPATYRK